MVFNLLYLKVWHPTWAWLSYTFTCFTLLVSYTVSTQFIVIFRLQNLQSPSDKSVVLMPCITACCFNPSTGPASTCRGRGGGCLLQVSNATSDSVVSSWKICPSPSTWRTHILQVRSTVLEEKRSRVKQQWRFLCEPLHTCWKESSCREVESVEELHRWEKPCGTLCMAFYWKRSKMSSLPGTWLAVCSSIMCGKHHGWKASGCGCCP